MRVAVVGDVMGVVDSGGEHHTDGGVMAVMLMGRGVNRVLGRKYRRRTPASSSLVAQRNRHEAVVACDKRPAFLAVMVDNDLG